MRTTKDRIRHTLGFEIIGLIIFAPVAALAFGYNMFEMGIMAVVGSVIATVWNYFYNILFDHAMLRLRGDVRKTTQIRIYHAFLFEGGLLTLFLPIIAWHLSITLWQAFTMGVAMSAFYLVYAFVYNLLYDKVFPVPSTLTAGTN
ncbi:membrane protein [Oceanisphaera marina]|uniref:Membrane protein n=1 Tax=Oceanisphaera marina TaxID=2017550 RepID=A0ABQ1ID86_9GAMM|nr:PACE efflux transporter [Oceanisphaera marina]GGB35677.1 membrane protein [Oceanisphaera marina]